MKKFDSFDKLANYFNEDVSQWNGTRVWRAHNQPIQCSEVSNPNSFDCDLESVKEFINMNGEQNEK